MLSTTDQDSFHILLSETKFYAGFFLNLAPGPPLFRTFTLGKLLIINSFSAPLTCKSLKILFAVLQLRAVFLKDLGAISLKYDH